MTTREASPRPQRVNVTTPPIAPERLDQLRELIPEAFGEAGIDWDKLKDALGGSVDDRPDRYRFEWAGKRDAIALLQRPSTATLVPVPEESIDFDTTQHVFIEGENLEVLKLLYRGYAGRVKMIYIDPPYNTGNDFIYRDDYSQPLQAYLDFIAPAGATPSDSRGEAERANRAGRIHSDWLNMMYPRLFLARQLIRNDGVIFISINDLELHNLRLICNEVFGEENWLGTIVWKGATDNNPTRIAVEHEYIVCYARNRGVVSAVWKNRADDAKRAMLAEYQRLHKLSPDPPEWLEREFRKFIKANAEVLSPLTHYSRVDAHGPYTGSRKVHNPKPGGYVYDVVHPRTGKPCVPPVNGYRFPKETMEELLSQGRILFGEDESQIIQIKQYLQDYAGKLSSVITLDARAGANELESLFGNRKVFPHPKPAALLRELFDFVLEGDDLVLDFFAGSCSSADAVLQLSTDAGQNRSCRFIMIQMPELVERSSEAGKLGFRNIAEIGRERIRRSIAAVARQPGEQLDHSLPSDIAAGFATFALKESNFTAWEGDEISRDSYVPSLELFDDPLHGEWNPRDVIYEVALKEAGMSLTCRIVQVEEVTSNTVYRVDDEDQRRRFHICLDDNLDPRTPEALGLSGDTDLFVCRDAALDDSLAANLALQCRLRTI